MGIAKLKAVELAQAIEYAKAPRYRPKRGHILVRRRDRVATISGLHLPGNMTKSLTEGEVVLVGDPRIGEGGNLIPIDVAVGDIILYSEAAGLVLDVSDPSLHLLFEENVLAIKMEHE